VVSPIAPAGWTRRVARLSPRQNYSILADVFTARCEICREHEAVSSLWGLEVSAGVLARPIKGEWPQVVVPCLRSGLGKGDLPEAQSGDERDPQATVES